MKIGPDQMLAPSRCLNCGSNLDACSVVDEDGLESNPKDGDITVCIYCGHIMAFDDDAKLREMTDKEAKSVAGDIRLVTISKAIHEVRNKRAN